MALCFTGVGAIKPRSLIAFAMSGWMSSSPKRTGEGARVNCSPRFRFIVAGVGRREGAPPALRPLCSDDVRFDQDRTRFRHRHSGTHLLDPRLLPGRDLTVG